MGIKHRVIQDFQFVANDKKIIILKAKTILENYQHKIKNDFLRIEKDIIDKNPDFFSVVDWKEDLAAYFRLNKLPQPAILAKKVIPFIQETFIDNQPEISNSSQITNFDVSEKEIQLDATSKSLQIREELLDAREKALLIRETEIIKKENALVIRDKKLLEMELDLEKKGFEFDMLVLESNKNMDEKQKEFNEKLEKRLEEIEEKETKLRLAAKKMSDYVNKEKLREALLEVARTHQSRDQLINWINQKLG